MFHPDERQRCLHILLNSVESGLGYYTPLVLLTERKVAL
jgi:hypothetical protein